MNIRYFGHACFYLTGSVGSLILDPFTGIGYEMGVHSASMALCSHAHADHCALDKVETDQVLQTPFCGEIDGLKIDSITTFHDEAGGQKRGTCIVFKLVLDGIGIAHLGDIGCVDEAVVAFCKGVDILLIPVGGYYTIGAKQAKELADKIGAKTVIPMHFLQSTCSLPIAPLSEFTSLYETVSYEKSGIDGKDLPQGVVVLSVDEEA